MMKIIIATGTHPDYRKSARYVPGTTAADRELYQYREGFYRGIWVALVLFAVSLLAKLATGPQAVRIGGYQWTGGTIEWLALCAFLLLVAGLFIRRHVRFLDYRLAAAIVGFLVLDDMKTEVESNDAGE